MGTSVIESLISADPDTKFILTERSPQSFIRSFTGAQCRYWSKLGNPLLFPFLACDSSLRQLRRLLGVQMLRWSDGVKPGQPGFEATIEKRFLE